MSTINKSYLMGNFNNVMNRGAESKTVYATAWNSMSNDSIAG